jgi:hypothetical protein
MDVKENPVGQDIIGDIHGQADKLEALLAHLGYRHCMGAWRHPDRRVRFVGDFIDRGPGQIRTLKLVRDMVEAGSADAVMGNHEFNAIGYATIDPAHPNHFLRIRGTKNQGQHAAFLSEVGLDSPQHREWIDWFKTLPLWLEDADMRLVHACWHPESMDALKGRLGPNNTLTDELVVASARKGSREYEAVEALCKGLEVALPDEMTFTDKQGVARRRTRVRWWDETATTYRQAAVLSPSDCERLPLDPIPVEARTVYDQAKPVFFGHYWLTGTPGVLAPRACCVDYSAARDAEPLVAYRWDGESTLSSDKMVAVRPGVGPASLVVPDEADRDAVSPVPFPRMR